MQGLISDFLGKRAPVLSISLLLAMGALVGYSRESRLQNAHTYKSCFQNNRYIL